MFFLLSGEYLFLLKVTGHSKIRFFVGFPPYNKTFCHITCAFKRTSLR